MTTARDFRVGDRVDSPIGFGGSVSRIQDGTVYVDYSDKSGRSQGIYTPEWFKMWPTMLKKTYNPAITGRRTS